MENTTDLRFSTEFVSILDPEESPYRDEARPPFFWDLNLDRIVERIQALWQREVASFYYYLPANGACEDYRREVFGDVKNSGAYEGLCRFVERMEEHSRLRENKEKVHLDLQKSFLHVQEAFVYCQALAALAQVLEPLKLSSQGMRAFRETLCRYLDSPEFKGLQETARELISEIGRVRLTVTYENDRITVTPGETAGAYDTFLMQCFPGQNVRMRGPFSLSADLSELEQELLGLVRKQNPEIFENAERFCRSFPDYEKEVFLRFASEIQYYLSFYGFEQEMGQQGFCFAVPRVGEDVPMEAEGLYDLALACVRASQGQKVVSNDMFYGADERFFVLTGPNQGGKTTFARSLGQLVYFAKMGLDVPAKKAGLGHFGGLLTHFSVEESVETGRGKLKEELVRLAPMMQDACAGAFVVINELFTTAANYDACIMGKRVLEHFLKSGCRGIYVTHLRELSKEGQGIVSLRAMLDENGRQSFRIMRCPAEESAGAAQQAGRHGLTYEQLRERLQ